MNNAQALIEQLELERHPEGGWFRRVYASAQQVLVQGKTRPVVTAIRFLLDADDVSQWHRVDADEWWHWQEGGPLELLQFNEATGEVLRSVLGNSAAGLTPMAVVQAGTWQAARPLGDYVLVGCTVSPGFDWQGFELLQAGSAMFSRLPVLQPVSA